MENELLFDKFVLFGDSITERSGNPREFGLFTALSNDYVRRLQVVNRGFSGYTSRGGKSLIDKVIDADTRDGSKIQLMTVFFGSNDAADNDSQGVGIEDYKNNLRYIVGRAKYEGIKVIVIGPALVNQNKWPDRCPDTFNEYNQAAKHIAFEYDFGFVNLATAFLDELGINEDEQLPGSIESNCSNLTKMLPDGLHFNSKSYKILYEQLMLEIKRTYPRYMPERFKYVSPLMRGQYKFSTNNNNNNN